VIHEKPTFSEMFIAHLLGRSIRVHNIRKKGSGSYGCELIEELQAPAPT